MVLVRRTRRQAPAVRITRSRATTREVTATLSVKAKITEGGVSETDFLDWLMEGIERYHLWRNGWVGGDCRGRVVKPEVTHVKKSRND